MWAGTCLPGFSCRSGMSRCLQLLAEMCWEGKSCTCPASSPTVSDQPSPKMAGSLQASQANLQQRPCAHPMRRKPLQPVAKPSDLPTCCWGQGGGGPSAGCSVFAPQQRVRGGVGLGAVGLLVEGFARVGEAVSSVLPD